MKIEFGPTPDGKHYFFPADSIATKTMRELGEDGKSTSLFPTRLSAPLATANIANEDTKRTYRRENNEKGFATSFYALDYETPVQKAAVRELVETWKNHFNAEHPYAFTGEYINQKYKPFFDKMGAGYVFGPDKMVIREFVDNAKAQSLGYAPAAERFAVARELLEEDIHNFDPNSAAVRNELSKLGGAFVKRGNVTGWVIPPGGDLDPEKWGADKDRADQLIESARTIAPGEYKDLVDMQISYIIDLGLDEQAFGRKITKMSEAHELGAIELRAGLTKARGLYTELVAEHDNGNEEVQLLTDANGRPFRSIVTAALSELERKNPQISMDSVVTDAMHGNGQKKYDQLNAAEKKNVDRDTFERLSGLEKQDEERAKGPSGAYVVADPLKDIAKKIMHTDENLASVVSRIETIQAALPDKAKLTPMRAVQPFVAVGPIVAISPNYVVQQHSGMREGVEFIEYYVHDRTRFLGLIARDDQQEARSASVSHVISNQSTTAEKWAKTIEVGNPVAIGTHAGVMIAMSLKRMEELNPKFTSATPAAKQDILVEQMSKETAIARYDLINATTSAHRYAQGIKTLPKLPANASPEKVAEFEVNRDNIVAFNAKREAELKEERAKVVAEAEKRLVPVHTAMIEKAKESHSQTPFADSRSTAATNRGSARIPGPLKETQLPEEPKLVLGQIADAAYELKNLIVVQAVKRIGKGDEQTFQPIENEYYLYNTNDSIDMFAHRNSEGRIARSYQDKKAIIALGFSEGHLVAKKDQGRQIGQLDIDNALGYFKEKAVEQMAEEKHKQVQKQAADKQYAADWKHIGLEPGALDSERREWLDRVLTEVQHKVANERNISIGKIMVERQDKDARFNEEQAFNESGIYVKKTDVRNGVVRSVPNDMSLIDLGAVKWMMADVKAIDRDVVVVHAFDKENNVSRIYPLQDFANRELAIKGSEITGATISRRIEKNDLIEFAKTGIDADGFPEYRVEIVDRELQAGLDAQARKDEAKRRVDAYFPQQRVELDKTQTTLESKAALEVLREAGFKPRQINVMDTSMEGHYMGIVHPVEMNGDRFVALVTNADSYQKQNGEMNIRVIRDQDTVDRVFAKRKHDGVQPEAGGLASVVFRDGKVAVFNVTTKEELKLSANAVAEIAKLKQIGESAANGGANDGENDDENAMAAGRSGRSGGR